MSAQDYSKMRQEFYGVYKKDILPLVQGYENERKKRLSAAWIVISLIVVGSFSYFILTTDDFFSHFIPAPFIMSIVFSQIVWHFFKKSFEKKVKEHIMPAMCKCFGGLKWSNKFYTQGSLFEISKLVPDFHHEKYDDIFYGSFDNVKYEIVEAEYSITTHDKNGSHKEIVFKGVIVKLDMNKNFNSHTVIKPDSIMHCSPSRGLRHTTLEDVQFEKMYDVFTNDEVDARYLITPTFMERLKNMKTAFTAQKISCAFYQDKLLIALSTPKDLFSICSLVKPMDDSQQYFKMYEEIISIIKLIDHFKLNQKIGM